MLFIYAGFIGITAVSIGTVLKPILESITDHDEE